MIRFLKEKDDCLFISKPQGIESEKQLPQLVLAQSGIKVWPVHRLDKETGGVMVLAESAESAAKLSRLMQKASAQKEYLCICEGYWEEKEGELTDFLYHDRNRNKTYTVKSERKGVKRRNFPIPFLLKEKDTPW